MSVVDALLPRLRVRTAMGDFTVDPWITGRFDLSPYGITGYSFQTDPATSQFTVTLHHAAYGPITIQPFASGPPLDLSAYGITSYEVVWGPQPGAYDTLLSNTTSWLALGLGLAGLWLWSRRA